MRPKKTDVGVILVCPKCGFTKDSSNSTLKFVSPIKRTSNDKIAVVDADNLPNVISKVKIICPKCGNNEAYWWMVQTRSGDEGSTRFFRCTKCGYTWREYE